MIDSLKQLLKTFNKKLLKSATAKNGIAPYQG